MTDYKKYLRIKNPKSLVLSDLPFEPGQVVEVGAIAQHNRESDDRVRDLGPCSRKLRHCHKRKRSHWLSLGHRDFRFLSYKRSRTAIGTFLGNSHRYQLIGSHSRRRGEESRK